MSSFLSKDTSLVILKPFDRLSLKRSTRFGAEVIPLFHICCSELGMQMAPAVYCIVDSAYAGVVSASMLFQEFVLPEELRDQSWNDPAIRDQVYALAVDVVKELWPTLKERFRVTT